MAPLLLYSFVLLSGLIGVALSDASPGYLSLPISKPQRNEVLNKRGNGVLANLTNTRFDDAPLAYWITVGLGTPDPQPVTVILDTGSSDLWVFAKGACTQGSDSACGGTFDSSASKSFQPIAGEENGFSIDYADGSHVDGAYVQDTAAIGGTAVTSLIFGLANSVKSVSKNGVFGVGFDTDESLVSNDGLDPYPNFIDQLVDQNITNSRAFSLYLDSIADSVGSIIFGGYDPSKYQGDLQILPMVPDASTGDSNTYSVSWTSFGTTTQSGSQLFSGDDLPVAVVLDSGTSLVTLPQDLLDQVASIFGATPNPQINNDYVFDCTKGPTDGTFDFGFGGEGGPIIAVPYSECSRPLVGDNGKPATFDSGAPICLLLFSPIIDGADILFGDTLLRSAYVVYDQDNGLIGIAQNIFNVTGTNVQPIPSGGVTAIPSATPAPSASNVDVSAPEATPGDPDDDPFDNPDGSTITAQGGSQETGTAPAGGQATSYTNRFAPSAATSVFDVQATGKGKKNAAAATQPFDYSSIFVVTGSFGLMIIGGLFTIYA